MAHTVRDAVAFTHRDSHGVGDGRNYATEVQQGETEALPMFPRCFTRKAWTAPEHETTGGHVFPTLADPSAPLAALHCVCHRLGLLNHQRGRHGNGLSVLSLGRCTG